MDRNHQFGGAWPIMVTPYDEHLNIGVGAYYAMIEWYGAHNVGGVYANCLSSEMLKLDGDEQFLLIRDD